MSGLVEELFAQRRLGIGGLRHHQQAAGVLVDTMHQAYFWVIGVVRLQVFQMPGNGIDKCTVEIATPWMHHHSRWFVDYHQVIVFIDYFQGDVLRLDSRIVVRTVEHQCDNVSRAYLIITFNR